MRLIYRILTITGIILLVVAVTAFLVAPQVVIDLATSLNGDNVVVRVVQLIAALLIDVLLLFVVYRLIRPRDGAGRLKVRARGAKAAVSLDSVQRQITMRVGQVADVLAVQAEVIDEGGAAQVTLNVRTRPDVLVPEKKKEIERVLKQVVERQLGLKLAGPAEISIDLSADHLERGEPAVMEATYLATDVRDVTPPRVRETPRQPELRALAAPAARPANAAPDDSAYTPGEEPWRSFLLEDEPAAPDDEETPREE
ncbi:MAG: hypothetical protein JW910_06560 [Anaerolineae bacterium]|nr:hypothetical protein [Anaerolineae bacterium]